MSGCSRSLCQSGSYAFHKTVDTKSLGEDRDSPSLGGNVGGGWAMEMGERGDGGGVR